MLMASHMLLNSELIGDFSALRGVPAFDALEADLRSVLIRHRLT